MLGCDEVATQLEYPWSLLPLEDLAAAAVADLQAWRRHAADLEAVAAKAKGGSGCQLQQSCSSRLDSDGAAGRQPGEVACGWGTAIGSSPTG